MRDWFIMYNFIPTRNFFEETSWIILSSLDSPSPLGFKIDFSKYYPSETRISINPPSLLTISAIIVTMLAAAISSLWIILWKQEYFPSTYSLLYLKIISTLSLTFCICDKIHSQDIASMSQYDSRSHLASKLHATTHSCTTPTIIYIKIIFSYHINFWR